MEGNDCYKFSTIRNFISKTGQKKIRITCDIGANVGTVSLLMKSYFPSAKVHGYEAVDEYYQIACSRTRHDADIKMRRAAVTSAHLFADDLGEVPREGPIGLKVLKALPEAGRGWRGGSHILPADHKAITADAPPRGFRKTLQVVRPITLREVVEEIREREEAQEIDVMKLDCEGCECSTLGCADPETLRRIRFIVGEYHNIERFYKVMRKKVFLTHKVNLVGDRRLGCFFAERLEGRKDGILRYAKDGMLIARPWLSTSPIDWHLFNDEFVLPRDRRVHALP